MYENVPHTMLTFEPLFKSSTIYLADGVEAIAGIIIAVAALEAAMSVVFLFTRPQLSNTTEDIRLRLGRWLSLALEFELAADILRTAVAPTWNEIGQLGAIIVLRTVLNFFLQREIDKAAETSRKLTD